MTTTRRWAIAGAIAALAVTALAGCSSSSGTPDSSSTSAMPSTSATADGTASMLPPVMINIGESAATAEVGDYINILTSDNDIGGIMIATDRPDLVELTQAYEEENGAAFNPGGKALAPGVAIITVTYPDGTIRMITLTITA